MNIRTSAGAANLNPELLAAITAAVQAFIEQDAARSPTKRSGISAWRRVAHAAFDHGSPGWRRQD